MGQCREVVEFTNVSLVYQRAHNRAGSLKEFAVQLLKRQVRYESFVALDRVTFSIKQGELLAVIGPNGAGKSTLMKLIARVLPPTDGRVVVRGSVAPMIELAGGFDIELTTTENVILLGALLGRPPEFMRRRVDQIVQWAGLEDYGDVPVRAFSSGMLARLGFAVATDVEPDVLAVDEVLAVGDQEFQRRSAERIRSLIDAGTTVILVSHDLDLVRSFATRVMWLDHGRVQMMGPAHEVVSQYQSTSRSDPQ